MSEPTHKCKTCGTALFRDELEQEGPPFFIYSHWLTDGVGRKKCWPVMEIPKTKGEAQ